MSYTVRKIGQPYTLEHRVYIEKDGVPVSPFHDIPLYANEEQTILNMVVEIPRWTNAKQEVRSSISSRQNKDSLIAMKSAMPFVMVLFSILTDRCIIRSPRRNS